MKGGQSLWDGGSSTYGHRFSSSCDIYVSEHLSATCPTCGHLMNVLLTTVNPPEKNKAVVKEAQGKKKKRKLTEGYVKEVVTYMVMDDLVVKPMSTISSITLVNSFGEASLRKKRCLLEKMR
ncbi:hypothetical protein LXL04_021972 [Taraxacum kok-saghyz]